MLTAVNLAPIDDLANIEAVLEQMGERAYAKAGPTDAAAIRKLPTFAANLMPIKLLRQCANGAQRQIARKDRANRLGLGRDAHDLLLHRRIAKRNRTADPKAFALGGRDLVAHPLPDQLPFELGKR